MMKPVLFGSALLLLLLPWTLIQCQEPTMIELKVKNSLNGIPTRTYRTSVAYRGILLGAMRRIMNSNANFNFTYTEDPNYGPYLQSVNGVAGNVTARTYWQLLVHTPQGKTIIPDVGIGCYIPANNDKVILNFTTF